MEKITWTDHVKNEVLLRAKEQRNILHEISKQKANWIGQFYIYWTVYHWIGHILRRNCLLQLVIVGKIKEGGRGGSGRKTRKKK
jgi:hypothetical protein